VESTLLRCSWIAMRLAFQPPTSSTMAGAEQAAEHQHGDEGRLLLFAFRFPVREQVNADHQPNLRRPGRRQPGRTAPSCAQLRFAQAGRQQHAVEGRHHGGRDARAAADQSTRPGSWALPPASQIWSMRV
jgi:hypothetical protein